MRKKIIASIILIMMLWQTFGNLCIAFVNDVEEANNVINDNVVEVNSISDNVTSNTIIKENNTVSDDKIEENEVVNDIETDNVAESGNVNNTNVEIGDQYITEDDLLYSSKYLVKDKVVSRIDPKTTILEFKQRVEVAEGNELSFYKKDGITQVTEGILGTGMIVKGTNGQEYRLSIKGDMTGEGETNQVELTMIIRHVIELQGWELTDINAISGDISGDGEINLVDIDKMIKHIVFSDWEYDDRTTPNPPTIEIVGKEGEQTDLYTSEVKVRIVEDKSTQNLKTTYKLSGKVEKEESSIEENEEIEITEDGEYLITAYTYGIQGNRSKASNRKIVIKKPEEPEKPEKLEIYNIIYELNGGENNSENPKVYTFGKETILKNPTREGYTFEGWYKEAEFTNKIEKIETTQTGDITVYAKWKANQYAINYELNGGENSAENPATYTYGTETALKNPTKVGHTFEGWYTEPEFTNKMEKIESTRIGDITVYAKWKINTYNITYMLDGGENHAENPTTYTYGTETTLKNPTKVGYTFEGWYEEVEFTNKIEKIESTRTGDITVYAKWKVNQYTINYELNGGENSAENPATYTYGTETILKDSTREGYTFEGWYKEAEFTNKIEKIETTQTGDVTVYAKWKANVYNITYELDGGENSTENPATYTYGTETILKDPIKVGDTFEGWYKEADFRNKIEKIETTQIGDITVYAKWKANVYNITYELNEGENNSENPATYIYGTETTLKAPTKEGHTFEGWYKEAEFTNKIEKIESTQTGDMTVYAKWKANVYNIAYELDGGENSAENPATYTYGTETILKDSTREGYTFEGWYKEAEFTNKIEKIESTQIGDVTVYAKWKQNEYKITGEAQEGGIIENIDETVKYGENSVNQIKITPNTNMAVESITINGVELLDYEIDEETGIVILPIFENVTEDKNIVVTFKSLDIVALIVDAPEGYEDLIGKEYVSIKKALQDITVDGVTIQLVANTSEEVTLKNREVTIDLNGNSITSSGTTVTIESGNLTLINSNSEAQGTIVSTTGYGVQVKNGGQFNLGQNEGTVETDAMAIEGQIAGVKTEGTFNFYDGTIIGTKAIEGEATEVPVRYNVSIGEENSKQVATLKVMAGAEAAIGQKTFLKLEDAIAYANEEISTDGSQVEITIINDIQKTETVEISESKNVKIDLNGYVVSFLNADNGITNNGKLEITDSKDTGSITTTMVSGILNNSEAELTLTSGIIEVSTVGTSSSYKKAISNSGLLTINGGNIKAVNNYNIGLYNYGTGTITVNGGEIQGSTTNTNIAINEKETSTLIINNGKIDGKIKAESNSNIDIKYAEVTGTITIDGGTLKIEDGKFQSTISGRYISISGGEFLARISDSGTGEINITGGKFIPSSDYAMSFTRSNTIVNIENAIIQSQNSYGINIQSNVILFIKNTEISTKYSGINGYYDTGIVNIGEGVNITSQSSGIDVDGSTINVGEKDGTVNNETIKIEGKTYGIYCSGPDLANYSPSLNFYDGKIIGAEGQSIYGNINDIEDSYVVSKTLEDFKEIAQLIEGKAFKIVETDTVYSKLQDAVNDINTEEIQTIQVLNDAIIAEEELVNISSNKHIVLDLNGKTLQTTENVTINNSGTLEITDFSESKTGKLLIYSETGITNESNAILEISEVTIYGYKYKSTIIDNSGILQINSGTIGEEKNNYVNAIANEGILQVDGGTIYGKNAHAIKNQNEGSVVINGGNLYNTYNNFAIYNESTQDVLITGGSITGNAIQNAASSTIKITGGELGYIFNKSTGTIMLIDGTILGNSSYGINNNSTGTVIMEGGTISAVSAFNGIYNLTGTVTVTGGSITARQNGIYNGSTGIVTITGGSITATSYDGVTNYSTGTIIIGEKDGNVDNELPEIIGKRYGINNNSTGIVNFYDGKIIGTINKSIYGSVNEVEEEYEIIKTTDTDASTETATLKKVASIVNTTTNTEYYNLQTAITEAEENETLKVLRNITTLSTQETIVVEADKNVILDLDGYAIDFGHENAMKNCGTLTIEDNSSAKEGSINSSVGNIFTIEAGATLKINGGTINNEKSDNNLIINKGTLEIDGGAIKSLYKTSYYTGVKLIDNQENGSMIMKSGDILSQTTNSKLIYHESEGSILITGGNIKETITTTGTGTIPIYNVGNCNISIEGGNISTVSAEAIYNKEGEIKISGGTITGKTGINNLTGTLMVTEGTITGNNGSGIYNNSTGTITVEEGTITGNNGYGIYNNSTGTITVEEGTITGRSGIYNYSTGIVVVTGGSITSTYNSINYAGIDNSSAGTVIIGEKDGIVNTTLPEITGSACGIRNSSTGIINFYDGKITGASEQSIWGAINETEDEYYVIKTEDETTSTETAILSKDVSIINTTSNVEYSNLQTAITEAQEGETLKLLRNMTTLATEESILIESGKSVILDLNGYNIDISKADAIKNSGTLRIEDNSDTETAKIRSTLENIIVNEVDGTLEIVGGTIVGNENKVTIIQNKGALKLDGGIIKSTRSNVIAVKNQDTGRITINSGEITLGTYTSYAIYNESTEEILITGGKLYAPGSSYNNAYAIYSVQGNVNITGGEIIGKTCIVNEKGNVQILGGYTSGTITNNGVGSICVSGGTVNSAIYNSSTGIVKVTGGTISSSYDAINNNSKGTVEITGGTISSSSNAITNNSTGTVKVTGGTIISTTTYTRAAIYNSSTGTIIIGEKDGNVSTSIPEINGSMYGIYNYKADGIVNFYDGIIKGGTQAINGSVTEVETDYEINYSENNTVATLKIKGTDLKTVSIGNIYYDTLQTAVNASVDGDVITLWSDIILEATIEIPEGRNITIELNGYNITGKDLDVLINNRGTVNIQDSIGTGSITNPNGETIRDVTE